MTVPGQAFIILFQTIDILFIAALILISVTENLPMLWNTNNTIVEGTGHR
jgi:hypothetical protein